MQLSPSERKEFLEKAAALLVEELKQTTDLQDLITMPLDAVGAITGLGPKQVAARMTTRPMGTRKLGVSLRVLTNYQKDEESKKKKS